MKPKYKSVVWVLIALASALAMTGCGPGASDSQSSASGGSVSGWASLARNRDGYRSISVEQMVAYLETEALPVINTHVPYEGELPGTTAHIPFDKIPENLSRFPADKDAPFVVYCRSGGMSASAGAELAELGYTNVLDLKGGMRAWERSGRELDWK